MSAQDRANCAWTALITTDRTTTMNTTQKQLADHIYARVGALIAGGAYPDVDALTSEVLDGLTAGQRDAAVTFAVRDHIAAQITGARRWDVEDGGAEVVTGRGGISIRAENITADLARTVATSLIETADRYPNVGASQRTLRRPVAVDEALRDREGGI